MSVADMPLLHSDFSSRLAPDRASFKDLPCSSSDLGKTVCKHLDGADRHAGESSARQPDAQLDTALLEITVLWLAEEVIWQQTMTKITLAVEGYLNT